MEDFIVPVFIVAACSMLGALTASIFGWTVWIGALVGAAIPAVFILGFCFAIYMIIIGAKELLKGGK